MIGMTTVKLPLDDYGILVLARRYRRGRSAERVACAKKIRAYFGTDWDKLRLFALLADQRSAQIEHALEDLQADDGRYYRRQHESGLRRFIRENLRDLSDIAQAVWLCRYLIPDAIEWADRTTETRESWLAQLPSYGIHHF